MNSKKRKLKYIREKNHYRLGGTGVYSCKISDELMKDSKFMASYTNRSFKDSAKDLSKKFKFDFEMVNIEAGFENEDLVKNITTCLITFKKH